MRGSLLLICSAVVQHASAKEPTLARPTSVGWAAQSSSSTVVGTVEEEGESCCGTVNISLTLPRLCSTPEVVDLSRSD